MTWTIVASILGIVSTILAYTFSPQRSREKIYKELDQINNQLEVLYEERDKALRSNNRNALTANVTVMLNVKKRQTLLLQRLRGSGIGD